MDELINNQPVGACLDVPSACPVLTGSPPAAAAAAAAPQRQYRTTAMSCVVLHQCLLRLHDTPWQHMACRRK